MVPDTRGHLIPFNLSQRARQQGAVQLNLETVHYSSAQMEQILREQVFYGQSTNDLLRTTWVGALGFFVVGLLFVFIRDRVHRRLDKDEEREERNSMEIIVRLGRDTSRRERVLIAWYRQGLK